MSQTNGYLGALNVTKGQGEFNAFSFFVQSLINKICTVSPVEILAVNTTAQTVNVRVLVNQINGDGTPTPHGIINNIQYQRIQGGTSAVIIDPVVGDNGYCVFASHDISSVKVNKGQANPGSRRRYDWADGIYIGGILNGTPTEFIEFTNGGGVTITTPGTHTINAAGKTWTFGSAGLTMSDGVVAETHVHQYIPGSGAPTDTGPPIA